MRFIALNPLKWNVTVSYVMLWKTSWVCTGMLWRPVGGRMYSLEFAYMRSKTITISFLRSSTDKRWPTNVPFATVKGASQSVSHCLDALFRLPRLQYPPLPTPEYSFGNSRWMRQEYPYQSLSKGLEDKLIKLLHCQVVCRTGC